MTDNLIFKAPNYPSYQCFHGFILSIKCPSDCLMASVDAHVAELNKQLPQLRNVDITTPITGFTHRVNAKPVSYRLRCYIRLQFSHGFILSSSIQFDATSLGRGLGQKIEAEDLFIWKRQSGAISNG